MDRATFDRHVGIACRILRDQRRGWGKTTAEGIIGAQKSVTQSGH